MVHDYGLEDVVVNADYVKHLLECLWEDLEDLWVFGGFEDSLKCLKTFQNVDLSQRHLALDILVVDGRRIVAYHSDQPEYLDGLAELLQAFRMHRRYCVRNPIQIVSSFNQRKQQRQNVETRLQM